MDDSSINVDKIQALKKYKQQQFVSTLLFYPLATLLCGLFFTSPFWFPPVYSSTKNFTFVSIPRFLSFFLSVKSLFILGNLIVVFLVRESKIRALVSSHNDKIDNSVKIPLKPKSKDVKMCSNSPTELAKNKDNRPVRSPLKAKSKEVKLHTKSPTLLVDKGVTENSLKQAKSVVLPSLPRKIFTDEVGNKTVAKAAEARLLMCQAEEEETAHERKEDKAKRLNGVEGDDEQNTTALSTDELKKRADDFIARVNKQIRFEAS